MSEQSTVQQLSTVADSTSDTLASPINSTFEAGLVQIRTLVRYIGNSWIGKIFLVPFDKATLLLNDSIAHIWLSHNHSIFIAVYVSHLVKFNKNSWQIMEIQQCDGGDQTHNPLIGSPECYHWAKWGPCLYNTYLSAASVGWWMYCCHNIVLFSIN